MNKLNPQDIANAEEKLQEEEAKKIVISQIITEVVNEEMVANCLSIVRHRRIIDKLVDMSEGKEGEEITVLDEQIKKYEFDIKKRQIENEDLKLMMRSSSTLTDVMELLK